MKLETDGWSGCIGGYMEKSIRGVHYKISRDKEGMFVLEGLLHGYYVLVSKYHIAVDAKRAAHKDARERKL